MCGRFTSAAKKEQMREEFKIGNKNPDIFEPRYNIAPSQMIDAVLSKDGERILNQLKWGLVPHWAKDADIGNRMINARAETITEKPSFREAFQKRRCIIPASGFYEWQQTKGSGGKQPYYFYLTEKPVFGFAVQISLDESDFSDAEEIRQGTENTAGSLPETFSVTRSTNLTNPEENFVRVAHSSNNVLFGEWSDVLPVTFADDDGTGGSGGGTAPETAAPPTIGAPSYDEATDTATVPFTPQRGAGTFRGEYRIDGGAWQLANDAIAAAASSFDAVIPQLSLSQSVEFQVKRNDVAGYSTSSAPLTIPALPPSGNLPPAFNFAHYLSGKNTGRFSLAWEPQGGEGIFIVQGRNSNGGNYWGELTETFGAGATSGHIDYPPPPFYEEWSFRIHRVGVGTEENDSDWGHVDFIPVNGSGGLVGL